MGQFEIVILKSGIKSLRCLERGETFHPAIGPLSEATILHIEQQRIRERASLTDRFVIWDIGFGAAANVIAAIETLRDITSQIEIHSFDRNLEALDFAILHAEELGYILPHQDRLNRLVVERQIQLTPQIQWHLHLGDFSELIQAQKYAAPNAIFYDPYSAKGNSEMWTLETFTSLFRALDPEVPCTLTNYTRSTSVRVALLLAGFYVGTGCIIGEKNETTFAANELSLVCQPLDRSWLERVRNSTNAAPLHRGAGYSLAAISASDFALLESRPQFSR